MTLYDFNKLDALDKSTAILFLSVQIANRQHKEAPGTIIYLYQFPQFYVEVFYDIGEDRPKRFLSFTSLDRLVPYLNEIDISEIYFI